MVSSGYPGISVQRYGRASKHPHTAHEGAPPPQIVGSRPHHRCRLVANHVAKMDYSRQQRL